MIQDVNERLRLTLTGRDLTISISHADEHRLRAWVDRMNHDEQRFTNHPEPQSPDDDHTLEAVILACMDAGLAEDEDEHGLAAMPWGDLLSKDVAEAEYGS